MKKILIVLLIIAVLVGAYYVYATYFMSSSTIDDGPFTSQGDCEVKTQKKCHFINGSKSWLPLPTFKN
jgi:hypothetical protein